MTIDINSLAEQVRGPGKFEGQPPEAAHFYNVSMDGDGEFLAGMEDDNHSAIKFTVDAEEAGAFGLVIGTDVVLVEDNCGFVSLCSVEQYESWKS